MNESETQTIIDTLRTDATSWDNHVASHIEALRLALRTAISITENCCGCIYLSDEDGLCYELRGGKPIDAINQVL